MWLESRVKALREVRSPPEKHLKSLDTLLRIILGRETSRIRETTPKTQAAEKTTAQALSRWIKAGPSEKALSIGKIRELESRDFYHQRKDGNWGPQPSPPAQRKV